MHPSQVRMPLEHLTLCAQRQRELDAELATWVVAARARGHSWAEIAIPLGITRQAAWERFRHLDDLTE